MLKKSSIFAEIPQSLPEELESQLAKGQQFRLKRIVSQGHSTDWYDQDDSEWVILLQGEAHIDCKLSKSGEVSTVYLKAGDYLHITAHQIHRVSWTSSQPQAIWLALYFQPE